MPNVRPKKIKSWAELRAGITPGMPGEGGERIPWTWYSRKTYIDAVTTSLVFFDATGVPTTTNMQAASQIPAPMFFDVYHLGVYFDLPPSVTAIVAAAGITGAIDDLVNLVDGVVRFNVAQKRYWESPIWQAPAGAGVVSRMAAAGTYTATDGDWFNHAINGLPDLRNRLNFWGDITIPHNQHFEVTLDWASAVNTAVGNVDIIVYLEGFLYRRVL